MAITLIQTVSGNEAIATGSGPYKNVYSFSITPTSGNTLILSTGYGDADTITISDNKSNTWAMDKTQSLTSHRQAVIWRASNVASGATTITVQANSGQFPDSAYICDEFSGLQSSPLDQTTGANTSSGTTYSAGSVTTTVADELLIGAIVTENSTPSLTGDAAWQTILTQAAGDIYTAISRQYRIVSSTGTYSWTVTNSTPYFAAQAVATYKGVAAAVTAANPLLIIGD
jgi:hypothetical protein